MMNYEAYKEEIIKMLLDEGIASFGVFKGKIKTCYRAKCSECNFDGVPSCRDARKDWLNAECIEKPKLTQHERKLCEVLKKGWIARDKDERLFAFKTKPKKGCAMWIDSEALSMFHDFMPNSFKFIQWQDKEPWSIEDLLKLEVEE